MLQINIQILALFHYFLSNFDNYNHQFTFSNYIFFGNTITDICKFFVAKLGSLINSNIMRQNVLDITAKTLTFLTY